MQIPADGFDQMLSLTRNFMVALTGVSAVIVVMITAVFTHLIAGFFGAEGTVKKVMSAFSYAYIIPVIGALLSAVVGLVAGLDSVSFGPAMILGTDQIGTPLYSILSSLDIFTLWYIGVSIFSIKTIEEISTTKASICVLIPYIVGLVIGIVL